MHPNFHKANELTSQIIGAGVAVHRHFGPGLLESIYERCLVRELELNGMSCQRQAQIQIEYRGLTFAENLRLDVLVNGCVLVELKCVETILPIHKAQLLSYMKLLDIPVGLVMNFHQEKLVDGVARLILPGANQA